MVSIPVRSGERGSPYHQPHGTCGEIPPPQLPYNRVTFLIRQSTTLTNHLNVSPISSTIRYRILRKNGGRSKATPISGDTPYRISGRAQRRSPITRELQALKDIIALFDLVKCRCGLEFIHVIWHIFLQGICGDGMWGKAANVAQIAVPAPILDDVLHSCEFL
jgi:hypothetical protein